MKTQQPSVQQESERLFPTTRDEGREGESREHHRVGADESAKATDTNTSFATQSTTKWVIAEIWGSKTCGNSH